MKKRRKNQKNQALALVRAGLRELGLNPGEATFSKIVPTGTKRWSFFVRGNSGCVTVDLERKTLSGDHYRDDSHFYAKYQIDGDRRITLSAIF